MSETTTSRETDALRSATIVHLRHIGSAVEVVRKARAALFGAEHITQAYMAAGALILALEVLEEAAKDAAVAARLTLRNRMEEDGCYSLGGDAFTLALVDAPLAVTINDAAELAAKHPELMTAPEPKPDRKKIEAALRNGPVTGATLSNGGAPSLRISPKRIKQ